MKVVHGDLISLIKENKFDIVIHGCNCFNVMGAGFARQIKENFPEAYQADLETLKGDPKKLGTYSSALVGNVKIINAYTQYTYGIGKRQVDYNAVTKVFKTIRFNFRDKKIAYPKIGAGLAGGSWSVIKEIIDQELFDIDHTLVLYKD